MYYGVAYYPEQKNPQDLEHDIQLLIASGINTVRMGEFAWCRFEPQEGEFHFEWLDPVVERLGKAGIQTMMCTPTACPPAWMCEKYPEILYVDNRGVRRGFGGRRHCCYTNETYRRFSQRVAEKIGEHYGKNPYVMGFQIDNEPAQEATGRCQCADCQAAFRRWVERRYHTVEEWNRRTGGASWSQDLTSFSQIYTPVTSIEPYGISAVPVHFENPSIRLEFERFASAQQIEYQEIQNQALKQYTDKPITVNGTGLATNSINYYESFQTLDRYAFDYYPPMRHTKIGTFAYGFARGVKPGTPFWIPEFMSGGGHGLRGHGRAQTPPGSLKQAVVHAMAHGAQMLLHFQFRTFPYGAEQLNYAIVDIDGVPRRRYYEMQETASLLKRLAPLENAALTTEAAIVVDYDALWALAIKPVNESFQYLSFCRMISDTLNRQGHVSDVISLDADWSGYKLLALPALFVLRREYREKIKEYVRGGGTLLATFLTSVKDEYNTGWIESLPAGLTDLFGVTVQEVEPADERTSSILKMELPGGTVYTKDRHWSELLAGEAEMVGRYTEDYKAGQGVIARNPYGKGTAWYMGTMPEEDAFAKLLSHICEEAGLTKPVITVPAQHCEVVCREYEGRKLYYLFNFDKEPHQADWKGTLVDYLTGEEHRDGALIPSDGFLILLEEAGRKEQR